MSSAGHEPVRPRRSHASAFAWMAGLSVVTLLLGATREFLIARELRASGAADLFFRGLVAVSAARVVGLSLYRSRWIPAPREVLGTELLRQERWVSLAMAGAGIAALLAIVGPRAWIDPTVWVFAVSVTLAVHGSAMRALAERAGRERRGFALEWGIPLGTIAGATLLPGGALGPALGLMVGLAVGVAGVWPAARCPGGHDTKNMPLGTRGRTVALLLDALVYANLGLLDAALSHLFPVGGFARLNYAYLFVNAAIMVPSAAATVVALRASAGDPARAHAGLRRWAVLGGLVGAGAVAAVGLLFAWPPAAATVDRAIGWNVSEQTGVLILWSAPFAGLRLANTIGRQAQVAADPRALVPWDLAGIAGRALILGFGAATIGLIASPIGLAFAELVQLGAWWRAPRRSTA
ncbi:hypothetical protein [Nannocystis sp. SCPEA4]|uniref:hypothetical protein n=1 Tax=Nannocystis sp. SCPEA4 TaxID=2996787 RepID=UPI00226D40CE|nr:hypothetical protein [Nannocystis sp. SCPEA4]MCY1057091.1 hypothetical protein [Nannocystis sp. SCPEA4]